MAASALTVAGLAVFRTGSSGHPLATPSKAASAATTVAPAAAAAGPSGPVFAVAGGSANEFGEPSVLGYAFVIRTRDGATDLMTDYHLINNSYMQGNDTVNLQHGDQTFTAKVIAVSPDPHVALLRISGTFDPLVISPSAPKAGDTVTVASMPSGVPRRAAVVSYSGPGGMAHLAFSVEIANGEDGVPVLDEAGRVVGIAEPSSQFQAQGIGFAVPIAAACAALSTC